MSIAIIAPNRDTSSLKEMLEKKLDNIRIQTFPAISTPEEVDFAIVWNHPANIWHPFRQLKVIASLGAGVDHLIFDPHLPTDTPIVRIVDHDLVVSMRRYVLLKILDYHRKMEHYRKMQQQKIWDNSKEVERPLQIGILGLGQLGADIAFHLQQLGFEVFGYSHSPKHLNGIHTFNAQEHNINSFLEKINVLINILPLTKATRGILNQELFSQLNPGTFLINVGRGEHLIEEDLIPAIKQGQISAACLDVFRAEPLPISHPFWSIPQIEITPHIASVTNLTSVADQLAQNYLNMKNGNPLVNLINIEQGY